MSSQDSPGNSVSFGLGGRVCIVTGGAQGIGEACARRFAREGAKVVIADIQDDRGHALARELGGLYVHCDVGDQADVDGLVAQTVRAHGAIDVLVNNAGIFPRVPFLEMSETEWDQVVNVNLKGGVFCAQAAARAMVAGQAQNGGCIINRSSRAMSGAPLGVHYSSTKAGITGATRAMALALAPHRIRVNAIAPGLTDTAQPRYGHSEDELREMATQVPLGRMGRPGDIAGLAVFLASDAGSWITGQTYHINGGSLMP
jgi:3-oxoacyl-[acyl-carrier protein] reductase